MSDREVEVEVGRVGGPRRGSTLRAIATLLAVPIVVVAIAASAVLGGDAEARKTPGPSTAASRLASATASRLASATAAQTSGPADLAIAVPRADVPLDFSHRPLPGIEPGLTGSAHAELAKGKAYTLLARCAGAQLRWFEGPFAQPTATGGLPCDGELRSADLGGVPTGVRSVGVDIAFDLAADVHVVIVATGPADPGEIVAVPLSPDGSRPAALGEPTDAIVVEGIREGDAVAGLTVRRVAIEGAVSTLAVVPASAFPADATPILDGATAVSRTGFLAVPFETGDRAKEVAVFDLAAPRDEAAVVAGSARGFGWGPDGQLAFGRGGGVGIYDPITRRVDAVPIAPDLDLGGRFTWTTDGRIAATRPNGDAVELGEIRSDGEFLPGDWPTFDPLGIERARAADGRTLGDACDSGPGGGGCYLIVSAAAGRHAHVWNAGRDLAGIPAAIWAEDGRSVWMLDAGTRRARLIHSPTPTTGSVVAVIPRPEGPYQSPRIVGASIGDRAIAIDQGNGRTIICNTTTGIHVGVKGSFAGWADTRGSIYPGPDAR